jgi:hypothetical protein
MSAAETTPAKASVKKAIKFVLATEFRPQYFLDNGHVDITTAKAMVTGNR